jgi:hypothetical protein
MKAISYMIAGAALFPGLVNSLDPAPDQYLPAGWRYRGCYSYDSHTSQGGQLLNRTSDIFFNANNTGQGNSSTGVSSYPRALNGWFASITTNNATNCIAQCTAQNRNFTYAGVGGSFCCTLFLLATPVSYFANTHVKSAIPQSRKTAPASTARVPVVGVSRTQTIRIARGLARAARHRLVG